MLNFVCTENVIFEKKAVQSALRHKRSHVFLRLDTDLSKLGMHSYFPFFYTIFEISSRKKQASQLFD